MPEMKAYAATVGLRVTLHGTIETAEAFRLLQERLDLALVEQRIGIIDTIEIDSIKIDRVS
jgi:hypothetical protein